MTSAKSQRGGSVLRGAFARLEPITRAAVWAHGLGAMTHIQENARMVVPYGHAWVGTKRRQLLGRELNDRQLGCVDRHE